MKKRILAIALLLVVALCGCFACNNQPEESDPYAGIKNAKDYIYMMYKDGLAKTEEDFEVAANVIFANGEKVPVTWSVELPEGAPENTVVCEEPTEERPNTWLINVDEDAAADYAYKLVATFTQDDQVLTTAFDRFVPEAPSKDMSAAEVLAQAFALEAGAALKEEFALRGEIVSIPTAYSADYGNITVNIQVGDKVVQCYRLKGGEELKIGDVITVKGILKNYNGTIEFDKNCTYSFDTCVEEMVQGKTVDKAYALEAGAAMKGLQALRGEITAIPTAYSADYGNITVNILVDGRTIQCYRLKGGEELQIGDVITVIGNLKNYNGTIEFDKNCTYSKTMSMDEAMGIVAAAKAQDLEEGAAMKGIQTMTGEIVSIPTAYSADYGNITVNIQVGDYTIQCYRLTGGEELKVGDVITVTGNIKNYKGTIEFDAKCTYTK